MKKIFLLFFAGLTVLTASEPRIQVEKDHSTCYLFSIDFPERFPTVTLRPRNFPIKQGKIYYINHSAPAGPFRVKALRDGELTIPCPGDVRNTLQIQEDLPNLIPNTKAFDIQKKKPVVVHKKAIAKIPVQPGKRYRGSFTFAQLSGTSSAAIALELRLRRNGQQILHLNNRYIYSFPLLFSSLKKPRYCLEEITIPRREGQYELELGVELSAAPGHFRIQSPELTIAPLPLRHRGKYTRGTVDGSIERGKKIMAAQPESLPEVRMIHGIPRLVCNGKVMTFLPIQAGSEEQIKEAYAAGFRVMMVPTPINNWGRKNGSLWIEKNKFDWTPLDKRLARMAELAPEAKIILLCYGLAYPDFAKEHPQAMWVNEKGRTHLKFCSAVPETAYSLSGREIRKVCGNFLRKLGKHLSSTPLGKNVIMLHLSAGSDGQWYQPERPWNYKKLDYSQSTRQAVSEEIAKLYNHDIHALRRAWGMPAATFENLQPPTALELQDKDFLLDVKNPRHRRLIDWIKADQLALIGAINHLAGEFKAGMGRKVLVSTYTPVNRFLDKTALFRSKNLDAFTYLSSYFRPRGSGGDSGCFYPTASAVLHGKLLLEEVDYRNEYFGYNGTNRFAQVSMADHDANYMALLLRAFGVNWSRGVYGWFRPINQDSYLAWTGPYQKHLRTIKKAALRALELQKQESFSDILLFIGDDYQNQLSRKNNFDHMMDYVSTNRLDLPVSGLSNQIYLLSDLTSPKRLKGRIYIFAGASAITDQEINHICRHLQKDNNILIFTNDIGRNNPEGFSAVLKKLSGIDARLFPDKMTQGIYAPKRKTAASVQLRDIPKMSTWIRSFMLPEVVIDPRNTERIADLCSGLPGVVLKRHPNWTAVYIAGTAKNAMSRDFWRLMAKSAGISPALPSGDVAYSGFGVTVIHAVTDGIKTLPADKKTLFLDAVSGEKIKVKNGQAHFNMKYGETRLLLKK